MSENKLLSADPEFVGKKVFLRPASPDDVANLQHWRILSELQTLSSHPMTFYSPAEAAEKFKKKEKDPWSERFAIVRIEDKMLIGGISMFNYNPLNRSMEFGICVDPDARRKGLAKEATRLLVGYLFRFRGINKVHAQTAAFNKAAVKLLEGLGFKRDAVLRDHYYYNGEFHPGYIYSLLSFEFD
jgi:RimJ/RimL family protein N-acetyltransferase